MTTAYCASKAGKFGLTKSPAYELASYDVLANCVRPPHLGGNNWRTSPPSPRILNARWEKLAPSPLDRIKADKQVADAGYEVRARIDPIIPVEGWKDHYAELVDMLSNVSFSRITIGTLRGLQRTINFARKLGKDMSWTEYFTTTKWGKKLPDESRFEIYSFMIDLPRPETVAVCKETDEMIAHLGMKELRGNCVW